MRSTAGSAVGLQFEDVLPRIRMRRTKGEEERLVYQLAVTMNLSVNNAPRFQVTDALVPLGLKEVICNAVTLRPRQPHDTNCADAWSRSNSSNRVIGRGQRHKLFMVAAQPPLEG